MTNLRLNKILEFNVNKHYEKGLKIGNFHSTYFIFSKKSHNVNSYVTRQQEKAFINA